MKGRKKSALFILLIIVFISLIVFICYRLFPLLISLKSQKYQEKFKNYIIDLGVKGWIIMLIIQILQIFIAFIPGEIIEILSGILYGPLGGLSLCLIGLIIGSTLIYFTIKLFANNQISKYREKFKTYDFLNNPKKININIFILFLIPGIPKDIFLYLIPFLPIKLVQFLIISSVARIPSILSSTIVGSSLIEGNYIASLLIFCIFAILGFFGILFSDKIIYFFSKNNKAINNNDTLEN